MCDTDIRWFYEDTDATPKRLKRDSWPTPQRALSYGLLLRTYSNIFTPDEHDDSTPTLQGRLGAMS